MTRILIFFISFVFLLIPILDAQPVKQAHTVVDLVTDVQQVGAGHMFWAGVRMVMDQDWHVYWRNPGDSGLVPQLKWQLQEGVTAGTIHWPYPKRINLGPLTSYGYDQEVILWVPIKISPRYSGQNVDLNVTVKWLACKVDCIPGETILNKTISLAEKSVSDADGIQLLEHYRLKWPRESAAGNLKITQDPDQFTLRLSGIGSALEQLQFFPFSDKLIDHHDPQSWKSLGKGQYETTIKKSNLLTGHTRQVEGVLVYAHADNPGEIKAFEVHARISDMVVLWACWLAFLGGIILNFMPCVLPVLSLKIMSLVKNYQDRKKIFMAGLFFTSGVIFSFWILAGLLIFLQLAGHQLGWGFQFQSPVFVIIIAVILFLLALNMFGVFEVAMPAISFLPKTNGLSHMGSFFSGILTTIVATPCTAPFMGTALSFAITQTPLIALVIFTCLGLGMAAPFLILSIFPQWLKFVPKPGRWMTHFKIILGIILLMCVLWLGWVVVVLNSKHDPITVKASIGGMPWEEFSVAYLNRLRNDNRAVFVDFTAAWCLSCQVNDRLVLSNNKVINFFKAHNIVPLKADWTNHDPKIARALADYGKNSIPVYIFYAPGGKAAIFLPEILTNDIVLNTISKSLEKD